MFHNNFRVYQVSVEEFNIEIEYWNERIDEVERANRNVNRNNMEILIGILTNLGFDNRTLEV